MKRFFPPQSSGVALVVTLLMMSVLVMMVVGLAGVMRNEQAAARNLTYQVIAEQMADLGAREAMARVLSNSTGSLGRLTATGPGWMVTNGVFVAQYSSNDAAQLKNLDKIGTNSFILSIPTIPGVTGNVSACWTNVTTPSGTPIGRYSWWVDDEGTKVNLNAVGPNNTNLYLAWLTNFPISADWLFVDPLTLQISNPAVSSAQSRGVSERSHWYATTESLKDTNMASLGANSIGASVFARTKGHVTVWSSNVDAVTPWGTPKLSLTNFLNADPATAKIELKRFLLTNGSTNLTDGSKSLGLKYGNGDAKSINPGNHGDLVLDQIAANILAAMGRPIILTNLSARGGDFHPSNGDTSILRHRNRMPTKVASHYRGPYLEQVRARVDYLVVDNATNPATPFISGRLGIWVRVINPYTNTFNNWSLMVQPRKWKFVVKPDPLQGAAASVFANASAAGITYGPPLTGFSSPPDQGFNIVAGPAWEVPSNIFNKSWPLGATFTTNRLTFSGQSSTDFFFSNVISFTLANAKKTEVPVVVSEAYVMLDQVCLYESPTASVSPTSLRDWLTHDDLAQVGNFRDVSFQDYGQFSFDKNLNANNPTPQKAAGNNFPPFSTNLFSPAMSHGVRKIDPQTRFPVAFYSTNVSACSSMGILREDGWPSTVSGPRAWTAGSSFSCTNTNGSVTGFSWLWPDPAPGVTDVLKHPHFVIGYRPNNGFKSVAQLGAIHTGIPWRTLRLQPTPDAELQMGPPDWVLLDCFSVTNATNALPKININGLALAYGGPATLSGGGTVPATNSRAMATLCAMSVATNKLASTPAARTNAEVNGVPLSLTNPGSFANLSPVGANLRAVLNNVDVGNTNSFKTNWSAQSGWWNYKLANTNIFPFPPAVGANPFLLPGEILEVKGVAEDNNATPSDGEDLIEGRLRSYLDLLTTKSDTFSVWSAGQGLVVNTNRGNRTNVMAEMRKQTVFQRIPQFDASTNLIGYKLKILYTRNHVVE